jgi:glutaminase
VISPIEACLQRLHARFRDLGDGAVATYIPELSNADPRWFGIALCTLDGYVYEVGDSSIPFTIQSISKPFVYGLALEDRGKPAVLEKVGVEPTGDAFNQISLSPDTGRPRNPMINAGAIASTSLVTGRSAEDRWNRILGLFSLYAGRPLGLNEKVYASERDTGHRNRAISHMLRNFDIIEEDPEPALDLYFRQCSIEVTCRDLAVMAGTLATGGVNPVTRERVLAATNVDEILSVMTTCGMYDYAGEWLYQVGLPAKSGVAGGILAILPGQLGIAVFSPPLDPRGNSVRGVAVCRAMSDELDLHFLRAPRAGLSAVRSHSSLQQMRSRRRRSEGDDARLSEQGGSVVILELQGDLAFGTIELVSRRIFEEAATVQTVILDLSRNHDIDETASRILLESLVSLAKSGRRLVFVGLARHPRLQRFFDESLFEDGADATDRARLIQFESLDLALERAEDQLLTAYRAEGAAGAAREDGAELPLARHEITRGFEEAERERFAALLVRRRFAAREMIVRQGDPASELLILVRGALSVMADDRKGRLHRLSTLSPGMTFGELSLLDRSVRTAGVRADSDCDCWSLDHAAFEKLSEIDPGLKIKLLENMLRASARIATRLTSERLGGEA